MLLCGGVLVGGGKSTFFSDLPGKGVVWPVIDAIDAAFIIGRRFVFE
jgi:hypothetical protein